MSKVGNTQDQSYSAALCLLLLVSEIKLPKKNTVFALG